MRLSFAVIFHLLSLSYYILGAIFGNASTGQHFNTFEFITFFSYQIAVHFLSVLAIVYVSSAATKESEKTATCVHKLLNVTKNEPLKIQLTQFSMQLFHRKVKFTACNLFTLDTSLIFTVSLCFLLRTLEIKLLNFNAFQQIVKALSTYVIILVQFTINQEAKVEMFRKNLEEIFKMNNLTIPLEA